MTEDIFADPQVSMARDPHAEDAWTRNNKYELPHPDRPGETLVAGRASELGKTISNTFTLNMWHRRQIVEGMALRPRLGLEAVIAMNDGLTAGQRRDKLQALATEAANVAGAKEPAALGTGYHKLTELVDARKVFDIPEPWGRDIAAYSALLQKTGIVCVPEYTEKIIWNRSLNHCGKFDRLVRYLRHCDKWHVEDLKTGKSLDYGHAEIPVQLSVYAGADKLFDMDTREWSDAPEVCQDVGLVVHVPLGLSTATLYEVDISTYLDITENGNSIIGLAPTAICLLVQQWRRECKGKWKAVARVEVTERGEVVDAGLTWVEQMRLATTDAELERIRSEGRAAGTWTSWDTRRFNELTETLVS